MRPSPSTTSPSTTRRPCGPTTNSRCPHPSAMLTDHRGPPDSHRMLRPGNHLRVYRDPLSSVTDPCSHRPRHGGSSKRLGRQFELTIGERIGRSRRRDRIYSPLIHQPVEMRGIALTSSQARSPIGSSRPCTHDPKHHPATGATAIQHALDQLRIKRIWISCSRICSTVSWTSRMAQTQARLASPFATTGCGRACSLVSKLVADRWLSMRLCVWLGHGSDRWLSPLFFGQWLARWSAGSDRQISTSRWLWLLVGCRPQLRSGDLGGS
jgi:hypothetical protein